MCSSDLISFYNQGGRQNINREWDLEALALAEEEQRDLVAFLESLTGKTLNADSDYERRNLAPNLRFIAPVN